MSIDYEEIYKLTFHKNWAALLELVHKHAKYCPRELRSEFRR